MSGVMCLGDRDDQKSQARFYNSLMLLDGDKRASLGAGKSSSIKGLQEPRANF